MSVRSLAKYARVSAQALARHRGETCNGAGTYVRPVRAGQVGRLVAVVRRR